MQIHKKNEPFGVVAKKRHSRLEFIPFDVVQKAIQDRFEIQNPASWRLQRSDAVDW